MKFLYALKEQLRLVLSWRLILCALLGVTIRLLAVAADVLQDPEICTVWQELLYSNGMDYINLHILPVVAFSMTLAQDWDSQAIRYWSIRSGVGTYTAAKFLACWMAGFLVVFLQIAFFAGILGIFFPFFAHDASTISYEELMTAGYVLPGFLGYTIHVSLSGALAAVFGMFATAFIPHAYIAAAAPLTMDLLLSRITSNMNLTGIWNTTSWIMNVHDSSGAGRNLLEKMLMILCLTVILCMGTVFRMKRRVRDA